jgi:threonine aldolase
MINLMSDTVTKPTADMLKYMFTAEVGDDVFGEDPSINELQDRVAAMFGKEAALFCPSGTMTNQIAIKIHTEALDEVICDHYSHIYQYETGGYAFNSGVAINLLQGEYGKITADQVDKAVKPDFDWLPKTSLVVLENSCNKGGGSYYTIDEMADIREICNKHNLKLHLDGARLFNVLVETGDSPKDVGSIFDTISICMSKGLGAPVGSLLIGNHEHIKQARRFRKVMGGGMRQAGYLAKACSYALDHHIDRLKIDNGRAKSIGDLLTKLPYIKHVRPVKTNIVIFETEREEIALRLMEHLEAKEILCVPFGPTAIRFVFHLDVSDHMIPKIEEALTEFTP